MKRLLSCAMVVASVLALVGCSDDSCYDNGNSLPLVRFYVSDAGKATINGVTLRGIGAPGDSIYAKNETLSETYLPLRATKSSTQWIISLAATGGTQVSDTVTVDYNPVPYFAGAECGAMYNFELKKVTTTHHAIDSVVVTRPVVTNVDMESMRIYFNKSLFIVSSAQ